MRLDDFFVCTAVLDGDPSLGKEVLVGRLLTLLVQAGHLPATELPGVLDAVLRREQLGSTGIGRGLAMPHARHLAVARPLGVLATCRTPVVFDSLDGEPVAIIALCLAPPYLAGAHLGQASRWSEGLIRRLADEEFLRGLRQARSAQEIAAFLIASEGSGPTAEQVWLSGIDPQKMVDLVQGRCSRRRLLLFRCARLRRSLAQACPGPPADALDRETADLLERLADGLAGVNAVEALIEERNRAKAAFVARQDFEGAAVNRDWTDFLKWCREPGTGRLRLYAVRDDLPLLFDLFGNPFRPLPPIADSLLAQNDSLVVKLAQAAYDDRIMPAGTLNPVRLGVLGDALEDFGADADLIGHLRGPGPHVRGCFVLDLLLSKE